MFSPEDMRQAMVASGSDYAGMGGIERYLEVMVKVKTQMMGRYLDKVKKKKKKKQVVVKCERVGK
ncbi:hypothetical protein NX059_005172 [Plenodomus lindquistii]|nr:hypothetical protein NX059_005172 [Plenodomus lindquistii]